MNKKIIRLIVVMLISTMFGIGFIVGGALINNEKTSELLELQNQINSLTDADNNEDSRYINNYNNNSPSKIYNNVKDSIVEITSIISYQSFFGLQYGKSQGSGFIYEYDKEMVVITNNHVVNRASDIIVTFENGNSYPAELIGSDAYSDLAILTIDAELNQFKPLEIISSTDLCVGDPVIAIGNPLGLDSTMTIGIISQIGRTIRESLAGNFPIANIIQTSAAINPGNSGGPLLNYNGEVIGITTAIIENSEGLGFAIPSNTILKEIDSLVNIGSYNKHSWLGIAGVDMTYIISQEIGVNVTYGWLITQVTPYSPADKSGLIGGNQQIKIIDKMILMGGDIIIAIDGNRVVNGDYFMSYLEENTSPDQIVDIKIIRENQELDISLKLEPRPEFD